MARKGRKSKAQTRARLGMIERDGRIGDTKTPRKPRTLLRRIASFLTFKGLFK